MRRLNTKDKNIGIYSLHNMAAYYAKIVISGAKILKYIFKIHIIHVYNPCRLFYQSLIMLQQWNCMYSVNKPKSRGSKHHTCLRQ